MLSRKESQSLKMHDGWRKLNQLFVSSLLSDIVGCYFVSTIQYFQIQKQESCLLNVASQLEKATLMTKRILEKEQAREQTLKA